MRRLLKIINDNVDEDSHEIGDETFDEFLEKLFGEFGSISLGLSAGE